jgi:hypothetical protein
MPATPVALVAWPPAPPTPKPSAVIPPVPATATAEAARPFCPGGFASPFVAVPPAPPVPVTPAPLASWPPPPPLAVSVVIVCVPDASVELPPAPPLVGVVAPAVPAAPMVSASVLPGVRPVRYFSRPAPPPPPPPADSLLFAPPPPPAPPVSVSCLGRPGRDRDRLRRGVGDNRNENAGLRPADIERAGIDRAGALVAAGHAVCVEAAADMDAIGGRTAHEGLDIQAAALAVFVALTMLELKAA